MNNMEKTKYKSWGSLKKQMNDLLCDALKDDVSYFYTTYHEVHNAYGRATITYKGKELISCTWNQGYDQSRDIMEQYKKIKGAGVEEDAMFLIKANAPINTEAHSYVQTQMFSGKIKFLIDENQAKTKLLGTKAGQAMDSVKRNEYLQPFVLTTILRSQMLNLVEDNEGVNIILKQSSRSIPKDKFSAFEYGLYYVKLDEERKRKRKKRNITDLCFFTSK